MSAEIGEPWKTVIGGVETFDQSIRLHLSGETAEGRRVGTRVDMDRARWDAHVARTMECAIRDLERYGPIQ